MAQAIRAVTMPKWGIEMTEGTINQWNFGEGQQVEKGAPLLEVETEKIVNTVEAPAAGTLRRIIATPGDVKPVGALIAVLADPGVSDEQVTSFIEGFRGASVTFEPDAGGSADASGLERPAAIQNPPGEPSGEIRVSPIARRLAESLGIDIAEVKGAGRNGRITKEDVEAYAAARTAATGHGGQLQPDVAAPGARRADTPPPAGQPLPPVGGPLPNPSTRQKMSPMRATIARRMLEATQSIPHYRLAIDVEVDRLIQQRRGLMEQTGARVSLNDMLVRASALALVAHPTLNAQLDGEEIVTFSHADIAIAVATDGGLITPVLRCADLKSLAKIGSESVDLIGRARRNALTREEITGGTFTLSNLGSYGLTSFDAIINAPQVAILAVGAARESIVVRNGAPATAQVMTLTLSADHRVVDGAQGAAFLSTLKGLIQAPERL
jgi:pyruvate dehydrogenase E2 component (dihydrolipoyllysine-residue acetyltransferase)